jgi:hypothetical protein
MLRWGQEEGSEESLVRIDLGVIAGGEVASRKQRQTEVR